MNHKHYMSITAKYLPATNFKGSRIKLIFDRPIRNKVLSITLPYDHVFSCVEEAAAHWMTKQGFPPEASTDIEDRVFLLYPIDDFSSLRDLFLGR